MFTLKALLVSTSVLSAVAVMVKLSYPAITTDVIAATEAVPTIYDCVVSWLKPPYLYLVINCIIITIVASSKLQSINNDSSADVSTSLSQPLDHHHHLTFNLGRSSQILEPSPVAVNKSVEVMDYRYNNGVVLGNGYDTKGESGLGFDGAYERVEGKNEPETVPFGFVEDKGTSNKENEYMIGKFTETKKKKDDDLVTEYSPLKPPVSSRRRNAKASPDRGGRAVLRVSKPKKQDTLESTWKTITEGRAMPLTRHLRKSDTWERDSHVHGAPRRHQQQEEKTPQKTMKKAETFNDRTNTGRSPSPGSSCSSGGSGKLKRESSLSQDELNRRVEAFIKKFNEDMRLQRQESLNQYNEMINRSAR